MSIPRLGFLGVGWIGRHRMDALAAAGAAEVVAIADVDPEAARAAAEAHHAAALSPTELMDRQDLDGLVIATPSALHADQSIGALERGLAVFCQKPLGRTAAECEAVVSTAAQADRLLGVDLSYRHLAATDAVRALARDGVLGELYAVETHFHNAYGPDKPWFRQPSSSGGGAVIDLGVHLVDLALELLGRPKVTAVRSRLYEAGRLLGPDPDVVEDRAWAQLELDTGATVTLSCSWFSHAGMDADIALTVHGTEGAATLRNVDGSFYDFTAVHCSGTTARTLVEPPDEWGGRAAIAWARNLGRDPRFDPAIGEVVDVADVLDRIYRR